jgi:5-methyltetrahydropteroyltriglutamate--homocysteine methyltransferase
LDDVCAIYREEIVDLARAGCTYLQIDEVPIAVLCDESNKQRVRERGEDPDSLVDDYIAAINDCVRDRPAGMTICVHLCRGNQGHGQASGGYEPFAEQFFGGLQVDGFFLEYDTERAGDFRPLRFVPKGKRVVLGLVSSKTAELEREEDLLRRIEDAGRFCPVEQLSLSPQCGFASVAGGNALTEDEQWAKLELIVNTAERAWGGC